jgi:hypothetical protein
LTDSYTIMGSDGRPERYHDAFARVDEAMIERAAEVQDQIMNAAGHLELHYLRLAKGLSTFKREKLYLAVGYESFKEWADSPELKQVGYRVAHDLVRIADEVLPILDKHDRMYREPFPPISTMRDLLPILADENAEQSLITALDEVAGLSNRAAKDRIKELRGISTPIDAKSPAIFKAKVTMGESFHKVDITCSDGVDFYNVGTLRIKPVHFARWSERFGGFIEHTT